MKFLDMSGLYECVFLTLLPFSRRCAWARPCCSAESSGERPPEPPHHLFPRRGLGLRAGRPPAQRPRVATAAGLAAAQVQTHIPHLLAQVDRGGKKLNEMLELWRKE